MDNLLLRRRMFGLPYDAEIEYLQTDSQAYIDTGIAGNNNNLAIFLKYNRSLTVQYAGLYGNYYDEGSNCSRFIIYAASSGICSINSKASGSIPVAIPVNNIMVEVEHHRTYVIINGVTHNISTSEGTENSRTIIVGRSGTELPVRDIGLKVYYFRIENDGITLFDGIPVRVGSVGYMYDRVSRRLFGNDGTGDFVVGPDL